MERGSGSPRDYQSPKELGESSRKDKTPIKPEPRTPKQSDIENGEDGGDRGDGGDGGGDERGDESDEE